MAKKAADASYNSKTGKRYKRTLYLCKKDDVWIRMEIPGGMASKKVLKNLLLK